jgi:DNA primase
VATLGTACTTDHVQKLFRFTDSVVFSFDGDAAGRRAARRALDGALPYATDVRTVKFLFLPAEHDPDSYIREFGKEAFARCVSEAMPLSRFLIEAASEECDLGTAEGRARLSSQAKPLWSALPDGALKRQLLGEIAALVQLNAQDLAELWESARRGSAPRQADRSRPDASADTAGSRRSPSARSAGRSLRPGVNRADKITRLLLAQSHLWEQISNEDHALLGSLPPEYGELLSWMEAQFHEHGPLPWGALQEALNGHPGAAMAQRLMTEADLLPPEDAKEAVAELRNLLKSMLIDQLKLLEEEAYKAWEANPGPEARERFKELQDRRTALLRPDLQAAQ